MIRDKQLDNYRALVMIHMVCVIHVIYWLGIFFPMQSFTLFAMSSVFFQIKVITMIRYAISIFTFFLLTYNCFLLMRYSCWSYFYT